jgi:dipeptidyl aminopeptidase/acylaminoacyl peptidase
MSIFRTLIFSVFTLSFTTVGVSAQEAPAVGEARLNVSDYLRYQRVLDLDISNNGSMLAYTVQRQSLNDNDVVKTVFVQNLELGAPAEQVPLLSNARHLSWLPDSKRLSYLDSTNQSGGLFVYDIETAEQVQISEPGARITKYAFSPDGQSLAYIKSLDMVDQAEAANRSDNAKLAIAIHESEDGVVVDANLVDYRHFLNPKKIIAADVRKGQEFWVRLGEDKPKMVDVPGSIKSLHWSRDGRQISVVYVADTISDKPFYEIFTSIGVIDTLSGQFKEVARAKEPEQYSSQSGVYYVGGNWVPGTGSIYIRQVERSIKNGATTQSAQWTIVDTEAGPVSDPGQLSWTAIDHYRHDEVFLTPDGDVLFEKTVNGVRALYEYDTHGNLTRSDRLKEIRDTLHRVDFSEDFSSAVFVKENLVSPPEIFTLRGDGTILQVSALNVSITNKQLPVYREVNWKSADGVLVHGWLLLPENTPQSSLPMMTFLHGGPSIPHRNEFAFYFYGFFDATGFWPYPLEAYATNGIAVFIPNYRGTTSYGVDIAYPTSHFDGEAIDDVLSGIEHLVHSGVADPNHLAISGHSHGAVVGPLAMTRSERSFEAASFAEGAGNWFVIYDLFSGSLNKYTHVPKVGNGSVLYEDPERYLEVSTAFHLQNLHTAILFEAGTKSLAMMMLGLPKAAEHFGLPNEFVVYPNSGHTISTPRYKSEVAERNLDWFLFWLRGVEDNSSEKQTQFNRWRAMRHERCAQENGSIPSYCSFE